MSTTTAAPWDGSCHLAIDLGAGSGRAVLGRIGAGGLFLEEVHRFHYPPATSAGRLRWPFGTILDGLKEGLAAGQRAAAERRAAIETVGVDSWGVDYGLLDAGGRLLEDPVCYRDHRTDGAMERVLRKVPREEIFHRTGIQFLQFNTLFQLYVHVREGLPAGARRLLMIPDLCHHALCGSTSGEHTNASTTQLVDVRTGKWADDLFSRLALPREVMPEVVPPGTDLGELRPALQKELGLGPLRVLAPATHDTGSAVAGTPLEPGWAYVSSGTWSLVGVERTSPLVSDAVARANFTNEGGAFGTVRFLKNVMGLWILDSCRHEWEEKGLSADLDSPARGGRGHRAPARPGVPRPPPLLQPREHDRRAAGGAGRDGAAGAGRPGAAHAGRSRLARLPLRLGGAHDREPHRRDRPRASHRRRRLPERLPQPGHRRRRAPPRSRGPRGGHRHRQPAAAGRGLGEDRLARRGSKRSSAGPSARAGSSRGNGRAGPRRRSATARSRGGTRRRGA